MTFDERFARPLSGHELTGVDSAGGLHWCLRCGVLWYEARHGTRKAHWEAPSQAGHSRSTVEAPECLPSTDAGANNPAGDARLMLLALTRGWRCESVSLTEPRDHHAWRWSVSGPLGGEAWSVPGAKEDGPVVNETVRLRLLTTVG